MWDLTVNLPNIYSEGTYAALDSTSGLLSVSRATRSEWGWGQYLLAYMSPGGALLSLNKGGHIVLAFQVKQSDWNNYLYRICIPFVCKALNNCWLCPIRDVFIRTHVRFVMDIPDQVIRSGRWGCYFGSGGISYWSGRLNDAVGLAIMSTFAGKWMPPCYEKVFDRFALLVGEVLPYLP